MVPGNVDVAKVVKKKVRICIELIMSDSKTQGVQRGLEMKAPPLAAGAYDLGGADPGGARARARTHPAQTGFFPSLNVATSFVRLRCIKAIFNY